MEKVDTPSDLEGGKTNQDKESGDKTVRLVGDGIDPLYIEIPFYEEQPVISEPKNLSDTGSKFKEKFNNEWTQIGDWLIVPRWSIPAWRSLNSDPTGGSIITAFSLAEALKKHPDRLLTIEAVDTMLDKVSEQSPQTVSEAKAVRKEIIKDLQEIVKQKNPLTGSPLIVDVLAQYPEERSSEVHSKDLQEIVKQGTTVAKLPLILDVLAHYPAESSAEVASKVITDLKSKQMTTPYELRGPHQKRRVDTEASLSEIEKCKRFPWYYKKSDSELKISNLENKSFITADKVKNALSKMKRTILAGRTLFPH